MKLKIEIDCDNDAFAVFPATEIGRILTVAVDMIYEGRTEAVLKDINGNTVGSFTITGERPNENQID